MAILNFKCKLTEELFINGTVGTNVGWKNVARVAKRKLDMLDYAYQLEDLRVPIGNRLEKLKGDLQDYYSIRINQQWRIIFRFVTNKASDVMIIDYH